MMKRKTLGLMITCLIALAGVVGTTVLVDQRTKKNNPTKNTEAVEGTTHSAGGTGEKATQKPTERPTGQPGRPGGNSSAVTDNPDMAPVDNQVENLTFSQESRLIWPVDGPVLLEYNMEHTIYFPTLDQYQCNPALILQNERGGDVVAAAEGIVVEISENEEIGTFIVTNLGSGYTAVYGQLDSVSVKVGDKVTAGQTIAKTAAPTKYYTVEGDNLYFELKHGDTSVDPLDFVDYE